MLPVHSHNPKVTDTNVQKRRQNHDFTSVTTDIRTYMHCSSLLKQAKGGIEYLWNYLTFSPDLRVMVPVSNLIVAFAVVRNGVHKMKGLFSFSLISKITKSTGNTCSSASITHPQHFIGKSHVGGVGHNVHIRPLIDEGVHLLKVPYAAREIEFTFLVTGNFGFFPYQYFLRGSAGCEFLEKPEHFSHFTVDFLALPEDGVLKYFHSFSVRNHIDRWKMDEVSSDEAKNGNNQPSQAREGALYRSYRPARGLMGFPGLGPDRF
ncbi:hypothetical protein Tco_0840582 [Tanacetum coccineum]|uniref:Uncharacterized protein n=1 Tax=Tanacetum coccineum TaxID=301880 RepID=A0ABQ5AUF3_9ASTR